MDKAKQWEVIFKHNPNPCYVADMENFQLIYVNKSFLKLLPEGEQVVGRPFFEVIANDNDMDLDDMRKQWAKEELIVCQLDNKCLNFSARVEMTLIKEEKVVVGVMIPAESRESVMTHFEDAMAKCMDILGSQSQTTMFSFCELLSQYYHAQQAYIYRFRFESNTINCLALWCPDTSFQLKEEVETEMDGSFLINWLQNENVGGIALADREQEGFDVESPLGKILTTLHIKNVTLATVEDGNHKVVGAVGLSNRENFGPVFDNRLLTTVSRFVAQSVTKQVVDSSVFTLHHRDSLTGLNNRVGYARRTDKIIQVPPKTLGVISFNINGLKKINDNFGSEQGDQHIKRATQKIKDHFDYEFYRLSGDEFLGLAPDVSQSEFNEKVNKLYDIMKKEENYDFSFGHAFGTGKIDLSKLTLEAETVMYINKQEYYSSTHRHFDTVRDSILADLLSYLANDEFMVYLQPQVRLSDASTYGAEALIRRFDKTNQKMVFPDQFIPLYEQKSIIRHVDMFVVDTVCQLLEKWGKENKALPISVNLSRVTLLEYGIVDTIVEICDKYHVPHELLVIEVTERVGLIENNVASSLISSFKENGFNISLDDFGCAYSNIVTLAQIRVDEVKIDKSLVDNLTTNKQNHILVKNVLTMCNELDGASTLAEGIEDEAQARLLHELGCHLGQGYFYSRPIPVAEFEEKYIK